MSGSLAWSGNW